MQNLQSVLQLHEEVVIYYAVDGYVAQLYTSDGDTQVLEAEGKTVLDALAALDTLCKDLTLKEVRLRKEN